VVNHEKAGPVPSLLELQDDDTEAWVTRAYLAMVRHPRPTRELLVAQGMSAEEVDRAVSVLAARGMLTVHADRTWEVVSPDLALPAHAVTLERRARAARASAHELAQIYYQARTDPGRRIEGMRVLTSLDDIHTATAEIVGAAVHTMRTARNMSPRTRVLFAAPLSSHRERSRAADGTELALRTVYDAKVLELDNASEVLAARAEGGERFRFTYDLPFSAVVVDDAAAVVDLSAYDETGQGSLLLRSRPVVLALAATLDALWRLAIPASRIGTQGVDQRDMHILSLLAGGASDATIARQTGVSQRTVERRVRALMDQLGAGTRFQAGVQAARRGLI
jgi:DNA-binding CsgD family transcriptional regulator